MTLGQLRAVTGRLGDDTVVCCHIDRVYQQQDPDTGEVSCVAVDRLYDLQPLAAVEYVSGRPEVVLYAGWEA